MIIQFNPSASGRESPPDPTSGTCDSLNWRHGEPDQRTFSQCGSPEGTTSKIVNLALACGDEHLGASYVEEIQAKQFKAGNSVALFANGELLAAARRSAANQTALLWTSPAFLDGRGIAAAFEPLPEAA